MKLAGDANVLLSAVAGGAAARVLKNPAVEVYTTPSVLAEIEEYLPEMARVKKMDEALLRMTFANLPVIRVEAS